MVELDKKWKELYTSDSRYFLCLGGRGSGKSFSVAFWTMMLTFELGHRIFYTRKTMTSAHLSVIPQFKEVIEAAGLEDAFDIKKEEIVNKHTGSMIVFKGMTTSSGENTAFLKSLTGATTVILEEAEELTDEGLFNQVNLSLRHASKQNRFILILNPTTKEHWIYDRFYLSPDKNDCSIIETTYLDNAENLSDSFLNEAERMRRVAPKQYEHIFLGAWREKAEGVIFTNWETGKYPDDVKSIFGYDDGFTHPCGLVETYIDTENKEIYLKEHMYHTGLIEEEKIQMIKSKVGNNLLIAESAAPSIIENLERNNISVQRVNKKIVTVSDSIKEIQNYKLIVDHNSSNLIKELNNWTWNDKKSETPIKIWDDLLDAMRYAVGTSLLGYTPTTGHRLRTQVRSRMPR